MNDRMTIKEASIRASDFWGKMLRPPMFRISFNTAEYPTQARRQWRGGYWDGYCFQRAFHMDNM